MRLIKIYITFDSSGKVYLLVSNDKIMKIGGSMSKKVKSTMHFYVSAMQGGPSQSRWCTHLLIEKKLMKIKLNAFMMIKNEKVEANRRIKKKV